MSPLWSVAQSCPTLCDPMDRSPPGSSVYGILQARILEWAAKPSSRYDTWKAYKRHIGRHKNLQRPRIQFVNISGQVPWISYWYRREKFNQVFAFRKSSSLFCTFTDCIHIANSHWFPIFLAAREYVFESKSVRQQRNMSVIHLVQYPSTWDRKQSLNFFKGSEEVIDLINSKIPTSQVRVTERL